MPRTFSGNWIVEFIYRQYILNWWINHFNFLRWGRHARNKEIKAPVLSGFPKYTDIYAKYFELPLEWLMGLVALTIVWEMTLFLTVWFLRCWVSIHQECFLIWRLCLLLFPAFHREKALQKLRATFESLRMLGLSVHNICSIWTKYLGITAK